MRNKANKFFSFNKLSAAQGNIDVGDIQDAVNALAALFNQLQVQAGKHIGTSCTVNRVLFNPD